MSDSVTDSNSDVKYIDIKEFVEFGFLQEVNRTFFHPLGLALAVNIDDDGTYQLYGVWDYRDDPEGIVFEDGIDRFKAEQVRALRGSKFATRWSQLGFVVQPVPKDE